MSATASSPLCLRFVRRVCKAFMNNNGHDATCIPQLQVTSARPGLVRAQLEIGQHNVNRLQSLHGGLISTLVDSMGSLALASRGLYSTGVSTDITVSFVRAAGTVGDTVNVTGEVVSMGRTLASTRVELRHPVSDKLLAFGSHTKFVGKAIGHPENVTFDEEGGKVLKGKPESEWADS